MRKTLLAFITLLLALGSVVVVPVAASAAEGDVGVEGPSHSGTGTPTGTKRATSSLWFNDGLWWGNLWDTASSDFHIFRFNAATSSWVNTGVATDNRAGTHHDVLWDGTTLYVASYRFVADNLPAVPNFPTTMRSYSYNSSTKTYSLLSSTNINNYKVETLTIDKDSTGRVWATWQQGNKIYLNVTGTDGTTWGTPFPHPASLSNVSVDDTSAVIAFGPGKMGLMWSREVGDATDGMYWSYHVDGASDTDWSEPVAAVSGQGSSDDHMNLKWLDSSGDRVFAAVKTSFTSAPQPLIQLLALNGTTWSSHPIATVSECPNRVLVLIDESTQRLRTFASYPKPNGTTNAGVCSNSGGAIYEKSSPLDNISFTTAKTARIVDADQYVHNVTSTKQNLNSAARGTANSGLLVLADVNATSQYWHFYDRAPVASFTATPTSGTAPLDVAFADTSTDSPTSWSWAFGDGDTSTAQNPAHTYTAAGTYTATLTATNDTGSSSTTSTITVSPAPPPVASFTTTPTSGTAPLDVAFTDTSTDSPTSWSWAFGDGDTSTEQNPAHTYTAAGTYTATLTATNDTGSSSTTSTITVSPAPPPVASFTTTPTSGTAPLDVAFTDTSTDSPTSWSWAFGDGDTSTEQNPAHTYTAAGTYTATLTATNDTGSSSTTSTITVSPAPPPVASFTATPTSGTAPLDVAFTDTSTDSPTSWSWAFGDGDTSTEQNPAHTYTAAGTYTATLTATNDTGSSSTTSTITVSPAPPPVAPTLDAPSVVNSANVDAVPVSGTARARPADTVSVTASDGAGNAVSGTATASSTGAWSLPTLNLTSLNDGTVTLTATATDTAGNVSPATTATVPKDTVPPAAPTLDAPSVVNVANVDAVPVSGIAGDAGTVSVTGSDGAGNAVSGTATASSTGAWSLPALNLSSLNDGTVTLTATATDTAGNVSPATTATVPKDTVPPAASTLDTPSVVNVANVDAVPVSGIAGDAGTVSVTASDSAGNAVSGTATASATGAWSLPTLNLSSLNDGTVTLTATATATDTAGNVSPATTATVPKDTAPPAAPTLTAPATVTAATVTSVTVSGSAEAGTTVTLNVTDANAVHTVTATATADETGYWSITPLNVTSLSDGQLTYTTTATDTAGNVSPATTATVPKDTAPPAAPTLTAPATVTAATATTVTISGSAEADATVTLNITDADTVHTITATATADETGNWSITPLNLTSLNDGQLTYTATATDTAGNTGASAAQTGTKKTTATAPQFTSMPSQITGDTVTAVPFAGTSDPGAAVALTATDSGNDSLSATATADGSGNWSATMNLSTLNSGLVTFSAQATDTYGNISTVMTATSRIGPRVVSVTLQNGGIAGKADTNDKVVVVFNEPMSPSSFCSTWTSPTGPWTHLSSSVSVLISRNTSAPNDTLTLTTGCTTSNFGTVNLGARYTTSTGGNLTFKGSSTVQRSSVSLSADGKTLTITLGALKSGTRATGVIAGTPTYEGTANGQPGIATDMNGVPLGTKPSGSGTASGF